MPKGNVNGANMQNGILPLNDTTLNQLKLKHPEAKEAHQMTLLPDLPTIPSNSIVLMLNLYIKLQLTK